MNGKSERVVILGASNRPDRYAYKAFATLRKYGHEPVPVHPALGDIEGVTVMPDLPSVRGQIDTVTLYVNPKISEPLVAEIIALKPRRVIFNPGTESALLVKELEEAGISAEEACTLVLLETGQF
ncbi:CoA-binding protein [Verrucomicrobiales bacterium BCK34]|nr:CoA-binding protein [Verrucomicrobiales bacterium BCK34]